MNEQEAETSNIIGVKSTNPKDIQGLKKIPYHLFPMTAIAIGAMQMMDGAGKYGRENYRNEAVKASIYYDAVIRHLNDWFSGEDRQTDNGLRHLGGALASIAILVDAEVNGKLIDDRNYLNNYAALAIELNRETVRIAAKHGDKIPKHYSKLDLRDQEELDRIYTFPGTIAKWLDEEEYFEFEQMFNLIMDAEIRLRLSSNRVVY